MLPDKTYDHGQVGDPSVTLLSLTQPVPGRNGHQPGVQQLHPRMQKPRCRRKSLLQNRRLAKACLQIYAVPAGRPGLWAHRTFCCYTPYSFPKHRHCSHHLLALESLEGLGTDHCGASTFSLIQVPASGWAGWRVAGLWQCELLTSPLHPTPAQTAHVTACCPLHSAVPGNLPEMQPRVLTLCLPTLCPPHPPKWGPSSPPAAPAQRARLSNREALGGRVVGSRDRAGQSGHRGPCVGKAEATKMAVTHLDFQPPQLRDLPSSRRQTSF